MEDTEMKMRPKYNDCRILNMRISWVKGSIIKLFVGWIQLLHLQDNEAGFRAAWGRLREEKGPRERLAMDVH